MLSWDLFIRWNIDNTETHGTLVHEHLFEVTGHFATGHIAARHFAAGHFAAWHLAASTFRHVDISPLDISPLGLFAARTFRRQFLCHLVTSLLDQISIYLWCYLIEIPSSCRWPRYIHCLIHLKHRFFKHFFYEVRLLNFRFS